MKNLPLGAEWVSSILCFVPFGPWKTPRQRFIQRYQLIMASVRAALSGRWQIETKDTEGDTPWSSAPRRKVHRCHFWAEASNYYQKFNKWPSVSLLSVLIVFGILPPPTSVPLVSHNHLSYLQPVQLVIHMHAVTSTLWFPPTLFLRTFYFFLSSSRALPSVFVFVLPGVSRSYISTAASLSFFFSFFFFSSEPSSPHVLFSQYFPLQRQTVLIAKDSWGQFV